MFERFIMTVHPTTEYGKFLLRLFEKLKVPSSPDVQVEKEDFVAPTSLQIKSYVDFLRDGKTGVGSSPVRCTPHKGKSISAYASSIQAACTTFNPGFAPVKDQRTNENIKKWMDEGGPLLLLSTCTT